MIVYILSLLLLVTMLFLLKDPAYQGGRIPITLLLAFFFGAYLVFIAPHSFEAITNYFANPLGAGLLSLGFFLAATALVKQKMPWRQFIGVTAIIIAASGLASVFKAKPGQFHPLDGILILLVFYVTNIKRIKQYLIYQRYLIGFDSILLAFSLLSMTLFLGYRQVDIGLQPIYAQEMLIQTLGITIPWITLGIFIAVKTKFLTFAGFQKWNPRYIIVMSLYMLFMAFNEELFYRGYLYHYLQQLLPNLNILFPFIASVLVFGLGHYVSGGMVYGGLSLLAGLCYGGVYLLTGNILYATLIHALTNIVQNLFFTMKGETLPGEGRSVKGEV